MHGTAWWGKHSLPQALSFSIPMFENLSWVETPTHSVHYFTYFLLHFFPMESTVVVFVTQSCPLLTPWTLPGHAPLFMEFSRQEYCIGPNSPSIHKWEGTPVDLPCLGACQLIPNASFHSTKKSVSWQPGPGRGKTGRILKTNGFSNC